MFLRFLLIMVSFLCLAAQADRGVVTAPKPVTVHPITPPAHPLPSEKDSAGMDRFSFIVYGDTRGRRDGKDVQYEHSLIVDSMLGTIKKLSTNGLPVRFVIQTGDAVVNGRDPKQWNVSYVGLINRLTKEGGVSYFLAPGNHDVTSAKELTDTNRISGLKNYLAAVSPLIPPDTSPRRLAGYPTFAFAFGNSFFLALDSNVAADPVQFKWAEEQLASLDPQRYQNIFAFFHHPAFSSGPHGGATIEAPTAEIRKRFMPLFRKYHVRAIFTGHEHFFEHWVERYQDQNGKKYRMDQIVTGGGGAPLYPYRGEPDLTAYLKSYEKEKVDLEHLVIPGPKPGDNPYHYVVVQVDGTRLSIEVIGVDWGSTYKAYRSNKANLDATP